METDNLKTFTEREVAVLIMGLTMDLMGEEWVAQEDEYFLDFLDDNKLLEAWRKVYMN